MNNKLLGQIANFVCVNKLFWILFSLISIDN